ISLNPSQTPSSFIVTGPGLVGVNNTNPNAVLDIEGVGSATLNGTIPVASISGKTSFAALAVNNNQGDLFVASSSGITQFVIHNGGIADAKGGFAANGANGITTGSACSDTGNTVFNVASGAISEQQTTEDFLIGGTATTSAKFGVINLNPNGSNTKAPQVFISGGSYQSTPSGTLTQLSSNLANSSTNMIPTTTNLVISGKYAFLGRQGTSGGCGPTDQLGCEVQIYDIATNSAYPTFVNGIDLISKSTVGNSLMGASALAVSGKYLYIEESDTAGNAAGGLCDSNDPGGCDIRIYDISNPTYPTFINGIDNGSGNAAVGLLVYGNYLYFGDGTS